MSVKPLYHGLSIECAMINFRLLIVPIIIMLIMINANMDADMENAEGMPYPLDGGIAHTIGSLSSGFFIENRCQWDPHILFMGQTSFGYVSLESEGMTYHVKEMNEDDNYTFTSINYIFLNSRIRKVEGSNKTGHRTNFYIGNISSKWAKDVPSFREVIYENVWDEIDFRIYFSEKGLKYDFILHPGSDHEDIRIKITGQERIHVDNNKMSMIKDDKIIISENDLITYYHMDERSRISSGFILLDDDIFGYDLGTYDTDHTVIIDPLVAGTYLGGPDIDYGYHLIKAIDDNYIIIAKSSYFLDFYIFLYKIDKELKYIEWITIYGGSSRKDYPYSCKVDDKQIIISGETSSYDFPITDNAIKTNLEGINDGFISKLYHNGSLLYSSYFGGTDRDRINDIIIQWDKIYFVGDTGSTNYFKSKGGMYDIGNTFISILNYNCTKILYSTFYQGVSLKSICINKHDEIIVSGDTIGTEINPVKATNEAFDKTFNGGYDIFLSCFNISENKTIFTTFIGGKNDDKIISISLDENENIYINGISQSNDYPVTDNVIQQNNKNNYDIVLSLLNKVGSILLKSTFLGGSGSESASSMIYKNNKLILCGGTTSYDYPTTWGALLKNKNSYNDVFITLIDKNLSNIIYSTFIGGSLPDFGKSVLINEKGDLIVMGETASVDFPVVKGCISTSINGQNDLFALVLNLSIPPSEPMNLSGSIYDGYIYLDWDPPLRDGGMNVTGYNIYRGSNLTLMKRIRSNHTLDHYYDRSVNNGERWYYHITAVNGAGESNASNNISIFDMMDPVIKDLSDDAAFNGREFIFLANITDNVIVDKAEVVFDYNGTTLKGSMIEKSDGNWSFSISIPFMNLQTLSYFMEATDPSGNIGRTYERKVPIIDDKHPVISNVDSPATVKPNMTVSIRATLTDEVGIKVALIESWYMEKDISFHIMNRIEDDLWGADLISPPVPTLWTILVRASDWSNETVSDQVQIEVIDSDLPVLMDLTPSVVDGGKELVFRAIVTDDVAVSEVHVNYSYDGLEWMKEPMSGSDGDEYVYGMIVDPAETKLSYTIFSLDISANRVETPVKLISIRDVIPPYVVDGSDTEATTGDPFLFRLSATDNIGVLSVKVEYWLDRLDPYSEDMTSSKRVDIYSAEISIPLNSLDPLKYRFIVSDASGNIMETPLREIRVNDNDPPYLTCDHLSVAGTGENYTFTIVCSDNIGIAGISVEAMFGGELLNSGIEQTEIMRSWIDVPCDPVGAMRVRVMAWDTSDNSRVQELNVTVIDVIPPIILSDFSLRSFSYKVGDRISIPFDVSDNIGIGVVNCTGYDLEYDGSHLVGKANMEGRYPVTVTVYDTSGNSEDISITIVVEKERGFLWIIPVIFFILAAIVSIGLFFRKKMGNHVSERRDGSLDGYRTEG